VRGPVFQFLSSRPVLHSQPRRMATALATSGSPEPGRANRFSSLFRFARCIVQENRLVSSFSALHRRESLLCAKYGVMDPFTLCFSLCLLIFFHDVFIHLFTGVSEKMFGSALRISEFDGNLFAGLAVNVLVSLLYTFQFSLIIPMPRRI